VRPVIGITTYREQARWGSWDLPAVLLPAGYADAVHAAGGEPVLLPTGAGSAGVLDVLDGVLLAGGADVEPARYGAPAEQRTTVVRPDRDAAEVAVLTTALERDRPVLAVCRGMQLLNVVRGGTLLQHLPDVPGAAVHDPGPGEFATRRVRTAEGSRLRELLGERLGVDCHHHQALGRLGTGVRATAVADDGTVEGVELDGAAGVLGVQWHPEVGPDTRLFAALVEAAAVARAASRR
jgi:anthranilate synthase component 2/putative glutamine amidotransferase